MKRAALTTVRVTTGLVAIAVFGCGGLASNEGRAGADGSSSFAGAGGSGGVAASGGTTTTGGVTTGAGGTASVQVTAARSELARVVDPQVPAEDARTLSADNAAFAFAAYPLLKHDSDNLVFSPTSISVALAMTYAGAAGTTEAEMAKALRFSLPPARLHSAFDALALALAARGEGALGADGGPMRLDMVNASWAEQDYVFRNEYLDTLAAYYGAGVNLVDFVRAPESSRQLINDWVAQETENKIQDLLPEGTIDSALHLLSR